MSAADDQTFEPRVLAALQSVARILESDSRLDHLTDERLSALEQTSAELRRGLGAVTEAMATRADLDDLRLEVRDATATTFAAPERTA